MRAVRRRHEGKRGPREVLASPCGRYRHALTETWDPAGPRLLWIMLNPSTADERRDDPTVARCGRRARALGFGAMRIVNLFALRATRPPALRRAADPEGPMADRAIAEGALWADAILCAWGVHGAHRGRGPAVEARLRAAGHPLLVLGLTRDGHPRHPLYLRADIAPVPWAGAGRPGAARATLAA